ncbi:hypothetical protein KG089_06870 [Carnobacteriaceae bacterium zg-ZUI252]|nr:hypothetical protein [Carnobacteriaceae bacterium zg-ZUI252]
MTDTQLSKKQKLLKRSLYTCVFTLLLANNAAMNVYATETSPTTNEAPTTAADTNTPSAINATEDTNAPADANTSTNETTQPDTTPSTENANETVANYNGTVTMVGQLNERNLTNGVDLPKTFTSGDDLLGNGTEHEGSINHLRTNFLGWSSLPLDNGQIPEGAKLYLATDKISTAFPNGIPENAKLYAVYEKINIDTSNIFTMLSWLGGTVTGDVSNHVNNDNKIHLNKDVAAEDVLPTTQNVPEKSDETNKVTIDRYKKTDNFTTVNEVVLKSEFEMNKKVALLMYHNPVASNAYIPVFSRNYATKFSTDDFNTNDKNAADYTYVDLKVKLGDKITTPERLYLAFNSYAWRPLFIMDGDKNKLDIVDPDTNQVLGNDKLAFSSLINNKSSEVVFGVDNPNRAKELTLRVILRTDNTITFGDGTKNAERILGDNIPTKEGESKADAILTNMTYRTLSSSELAARGITAPLTNVVTITDEDAQLLALTNGTETTLVTGSISGVVRASVGNVTLPLLGNQELHAFLDIKAVNAATPVTLGYTPSVRVSFSTVDGTPLLPTVEADVMDNEGTLTYDVSPLKQETLQVDDITYHLVRTDGNESGTITSAQTNVVYVYAPETSTTTVEKGTITVAFEDKDGNRIAPVVTLIDDVEVSSTTEKIVEGNVIDAQTTLSNATYDATTVKQNTIDYNGASYRLVGIKAGSLDESGRVVTGEHMVTYLYEKIVTDTPVKPDESEKPTPPVKPDKPEQPTPPAKPDKPEQPTPTVKPDKMTNETKPNKPATDKQPLLPETGTLATGLTSLLGIGSLSISALLRRKRK